MKKIFRWRRSGVICVAGMLTWTMCACGSSDLSDSASEAASTQDTYDSEEALTRSQPSAADYSLDTVVLPEGFESMNYPIEALIVEQYSQGIPYYKEGEDSQSFWFSMAVLSSLLQEHELVSPVLDEQYSIYGDEEISTMAAALYSSFMKGEMDLPDPEDSDPYAFFDEELQEYGLLNGNVGNLSICITACQADENGYKLTTQLLDGETGEQMDVYQVKIELQPAEEGEQLFAYTVSDVCPLSELRDSEQDREEEEEQEPTAESDFDLIDGEEVTDGVEEDETPYVMGMNDVIISETDALDMAQAYLGEDARLTYRRMVDIGDYQYYDFSISEGETASTDILVCLDGSDLVTGVQNEDGSWSFDQ